MNNVYPCPESLMWTPAERADPSKRRCTVCASVCEDIFARTFYGDPKQIENYCSKKCWDKHEKFSNNKFIAMKK